SPTLDCSCQISSVLLLVIFCTAMVIDERLPCENAMRGRIRLPVAAPIRPSARRRLRFSMLCFLFHSVARRRRKASPASRHGLKLNLSVQPASERPPDDQAIAG